jgi:hypothetical protein
LEDEAKEAKDDDVDERSDEREGDPGGENDRRLLACRAAAAACFFCFRLRSFNSFLHAACHFCFCFCFYFLTKLKK